MRAFFVSFIANLLRHTSWLWWWLWICVQWVGQSWRRRCAEKRLGRELALGLAVELVGCCGVLRVHHRHHELAEHLNLLDLGERDLVAHLNGLEVADRGLILELEALQAGLFGLEVLGLVLGALEGTVERVERGVNTRLRALRAGRAGNVVARVELLELLRQAIEGVGEPFLLADQAAETIEEALVGLPDAGAAAGGVLDHVLELLSQVSDGRRL